MTTAKRKKAVAAIRQIITAARVLVEIDDPTSARTATPPRGEVEQAATATVENGTEKEAAVMILNLLLKL